MFTLTYTAYRTTLSMWAYSVLYVGLQCYSMWDYSVHVNVYDLPHYSQGLRNVFKGNAGATHDNEFNFNIIMNTHDKHSFMYDDWEIIVNDYAIRK